MAKKPGPSGGSSSWRNPPEHTRFRKGQSGNPRGRPKGSRNFAKLLDEELDELMPVMENGRSRKMTKRAALAKTLVNQALGGDHRARALIVPRLFASSSEDEPVEADPAIEAAVASFVARYASAQIPQPVKDEEEEGL